MVNIHSKPCLHLKADKCGHPRSVLSDGTPWITCKALKELNLGCPAANQPKDEKEE